MRLARILFLVSATALLSHAGLAQKEPALTDSQIRSFIASFPDAEAFGERHRLDEVESVMDSEGDMSENYAAVMQHLRDKGIYREFGSVLRRHGFSSPEQWAGIAQRVMKAYISNAMGQRNPAMNAQMQAALQQLRANPNIPEAQKEAMLKQMQGSAAMMEQLFNASPADKAAVHPYMAELEQVLEKQQ